MCALSRDYYYSSGGLYDQAHQSAAQVHTTTLAPNAWDRGYSWCKYSDFFPLVAAAQERFSSSAGMRELRTSLTRVIVCLFADPDTPGQYPDSKWSVPIFQTLP